MLFIVPPLSLSSLLLNEVEVDADEVDESPSSSSSVLRFFAFPVVAGAFDSLFDVAKLPPDAGNVADFA